jgi:hypothetical protein
MRCHPAGEKKVFRQVALAACLLFCGATLPSAYAQPKRFRPAPNYVQLGKPDQAKGRELLEDFRQRGIAGNYFLQFELRVMPRRGAERTVPGYLWAARNERGPISRLVLSPGLSDKERRLLVQVGPASALWSFQPGASAAAPLNPAGLFEPLGETELTAFDLQMPFTFWDDFVFEGVTRLRNRPAHVFLVYPPAEVAAQKPELTGVRMYLDAEYHALVQAEQIGPEGRLLKSMTVVDLKEVDGQWMVKSVDLRNDLTRDKTRFIVKAAAVGIDLPPALFEPAALAETFPPPPAQRLREVTP